jgi:hypothetical protein
MTFLDYSHVQLSDEFISHVLWGEEGDPEKGGHFSGVKRENKTEFPPDWSVEQIAIALRSVLKNPEYVELVGHKVFLKRNVSGVDIFVVLARDKSGLIPFSAYPLRGPGVIQNVMGLQIPLPFHNLRNGR